MRGTLLAGWTDAGAWRDLERDELLPETSEAQRAAQAALRKAQAIVTRHAIIGVGESIGLLAFPSIDGLGLALDLPPGADPDLVVRALLAEGVTAHLAHDGGRDWATADVAPWYRAEEIDHVVLCVAKVVHVLFGLHPPTMDAEAHAACGWHGPTPPPAGSGS